MRNLLKYLNPAFYIRRIARQEIKEQCTQVFKSVNQYSTGASISQMKTFERCSDKIHKAFVESEDVSQEITEL